jgi:hypothetical protein
MSMIERVRITLQKSKDWLGRNPTQEWLQEQASKQAHTPDYWNLAQFRQQLYFTYGEDMPGYRAYGKFHGPSTVNFGEAYTAVPLTMFIHDGDIYDSYPVALEDEFRYTYPHAPHTSVRGILMTITADELTSLDTYHENGRVFERKRIWLQYSVLDAQFSDLNNRSMAVTERITRIAAWTYIGRREFWNERIDNGYRFPPAKRFDNLFMKDFYYYGAYDFVPNE